MRRVLRIAGYVVAGLVGLLLVAAAGVYVVSERTLRRAYDAPLQPFAAATDPAAVAEGQRLARIRGCYGGCHGTTLEGEFFVNVPGVATITAPNLTRVVRDYSDPELERVIRRGVKPNRRSVFGMPSEMFAELADEDLQSILGFLRSHPPIESSPPEFHVGPFGRVALVLGKVVPAAPLVRAKPAAGVPRNAELTWGRYLVRTSCTECHGNDLRGEADGSPPDLAIAAAFSEADWLRLMRTGLGLGGRELTLMRSVVLSRFSHFTDQEIQAVRAFLTAMARDSTMRE